MRSSLQAITPRVCVLIALGLALPGCSLIFEVEYVANCGPGFSNTLALFPLDGEATQSSIRSLVGQAEGRVRTLDADELANSTLVTTDGPGKCGEAMQLSGDEGSFVQFPASMARKTLSFDFWFNAAEIDERVVLLSKDGIGQSNGDSLLQVVPTTDTVPSYHVVFRLQTSNAFHPNYVICSSALLLDEWHHVAVSYDEKTGVELFVDGEAAANPQLDLSAIFSNDPDAQCGGENDARFATLESNVQDWIWGGSNSSSSGGPVNHILNGKLDELRFRSTQLTLQDAKSVFNSLSNQ